ncbi:MAG: formate dehydrogenase subunit alpha [Anaerolineaceae bacterium]
MVQAEKVTTTTCPYCGVGCTLELHTRDDFIYEVTSPFDSVVNHGNLCVKGRFGYDYIYSPRRITVPMIRKDQQKPGSRKPSRNPDDWREASWEEAIELVTSRMVEIYRRDGPRAIGAYSCAKATNEDNYLFQKMIRSLFRTNNIDHCTRLCHAASVVALQMAVGSSAMSNTAAEVIENDVFIITGSNTSETHPIISIQMKAAVEKYGAKLIVVDPRRIEMVNFAALWLPEKPGTDVAVFSAMAHVILKESLANQKFIDDRTENFQAFAKSMEKFTPEYAESISGVDRELIVQAARLYASAENAAIYWALGIPESTHGVANAFSLINLALLTGHIGRRGNGLNPLRGQNNVQGASDSGAMPWHFPGYQRVDVDENGHKFEKAWLIEEGGLSRKRGLTTTEIISSISENGIRAIYCMGENPLMSEPNLNHTCHMMEQLEFLAVQDLFMNETAAYADVFLPATSFAEKDGTFTNTDRRVQRVRQALTPLGQSQPDWKIICQVAKELEKKLGVITSSYWDYSHPSEVLDEMGRLVPDYTGVHYNRIKKVGLQTPVPDDDHPGTPFLFENSFPRGRGKFHPLDYTPSAEMPDEDYPFILTTGRVLEHWHGGSMTRASWMDDLYPEALMEVNPRDAEINNLKNNEVVRVSSRRGTVVLRINVTEKTTPGVVFIPFHFREAAANLLTNDALDPQAFIPEYKICAVRISKADPAELAKSIDSTSRGRY